MNENELNSIFTWFPRVRGVVNTPATILIPEDPKIEDLNAALDFRNPARDPGMANLIQKVREAGQTLGYPLFIKTGQLANKHDWKNSCYVSGPGKVPRAVQNLLEATEMMMVGPSFDGIAAREFLSLDASFKAFNGMPVAREFRYFIKNGKVLCRHPYWPASSLRDVTSKHWAKYLKKMQVLKYDEQTVLDYYAMRISRAVEMLGAPDNYWSLDFCVTKKGEWYLTDMATGKESYHYTSCPHSPEEQREMYPDPDDVSEVNRKGESDRRFAEWAAKHKVKTND